MINQEIYEIIKDELLNIDVRLNEPDSFIKEFRFPNSLTREELDNAIFRLRSWRDEITYPEKAFASLYLNSMIFALSKDPTDVEFYLDIVLHCDWMSFDRKYNVFQQVRGFLFRNNQAESDSVYEKLTLLFEQTMDLVKVQIPEDMLEPIDLSQRDENLVIVITSMFIAYNHGPTKSALDRCQMLQSRLGKKVLLINTASSMSVTGYVPFYDFYLGSYVSEYIEKESMEWRGSIIPYFQCENNMPKIETLVVLLDSIRRMRPKYVLEIGAGDILANLVTQIVPVLSNGMCPSSLDYSLTTCQTYSLELTDADLDRLSYAGQTKQNVIPAVFTMKIADQAEMHTRDEIGLPQDMFCIALVGARLDTELTDEFLTVLENTCDAPLMYVVFGRWSQFAEKVKLHPRLNEHVMYKGFVDDTRSYLELCDLYLNPPRRGGGTSVVEAMISGVPAITLAHGDVAVATGPDYYIDTLEELPDAICRYMTDKDYYEKQSTGARERALMLQNSEGFFVDTLREFESRFVK